jgi:CheY-like chemotaxis protein
LTNLIGNALKFTAAGGVLAIDVRISGGSPAAMVSDSLVFAISDSGIGMDPEVVAKLFRPFVQGDASVTRQYGGNGLGLFISRRLVEGMGGTLSCESTLGKGSTFTLHLPVVVDNSPITSMPSSNRSHPADLIPATLNASPGKHPWCSTSTSPSKLDDTLSLRTRFRHMSKVYPFTAPARVRTICSSEAKSDSLRESGREGGKHHRKKRGERCKREFVQGPEPEIDPACTSAETPVISSLSPPGDRSDLHSATFCRRRLRLNLTAAYTEETTRQTASRPLSTFPKFKLHVLIVDDQVINRKMLARQVKRFGCTSELVETGKQAVDLLMSRPPGTFNLVFMDVQMPVMDGITATKIYRQHEAQRARQGPVTPLRIVALTGHVLDSEMHHCRDAGMDDFLRKPLNQEELVQILRSAHDQRKSCVNHGRDHPSTSK